MLDIEEIKERIREYFENTPEDEIKAAIKECEEIPCMFCGVRAKDCKCKLF